MKKYRFLFVLYLFSSAVLPSKAISPAHIIPTPVSISQSNSTLVLPKNISIGISGKSLQPAALYLKNSLSGLNVKIATEKSSFISLQLKKKNTEQSGAYSLHILKNKITITATDYEGIINGIATFRQLLSSEKQPNTLPLIAIEDTPRFGWRGLMLDVSRHFLDVNEVKKTLDLMALYKLNKMHWHLTDDQGWRVEIKKYPLLTEKSAWRHFNSHDRECMYRAKKEDNKDFLIPEKFLKTNKTDTLYGGFYTQEEIKTVVSYAKDLGIEIIPEIDMPGHSLSAINAYNWLVCTGKYGWGNTFSSPLCPGKDETLEFCKNIYSEIFALFPSKYVHIGGDEVEKHNWRTCADCQKRIKDEHLANEEELQGWFIREMEKFFNRNGKTLIGWDEVLNDKLNNNSVIMWWRTWMPQTPALTEEQGKKLILCPGEYFYFDSPENKHSLSKMFAYNPLQTKKGEIKPSTVMGVQANLWSEWIPSFQRLQYMLVPRFFALSEIGWASDARKMDINQYKARFTEHFRWMDKMGINYRIPDMEGFHDRNVFVDKVKLNITPTLENTTIRYTTDGSAPNVLSPALKKGEIIETTTLFKLRQFRPNGTPDEIVNTMYLKTGFSEPPVANISSHENGLNAYIYDYKGDICDEIQRYQVTKTVPLQNIAYPKGFSGDFSMIIKGYFFAETDGIYSFALLSDDGSQLIIDNQTVIENDGLHPPMEKTGQFAMKKGWHTLEIPYFDKSGGVLGLKMWLDGKWQKIPEEWLKKSN